MDNSISMIDSMIEELKGMKEIAVKNDQRRVKKREEKRLRDLHMSKKKREGKFRRRMKAVKESMAEEPKEQRWELLKQTRPYKMAHGLRYVRVAEVRKAV